MVVVEHALAPRGVPTGARATRPRSAKASVSCVVGPVLGAMALGIAWLVVHPATADLAAQEYRTGLWRREGFAIWDAQWYGGHHEPGYSLLFGPLAALLGPLALGFVAGVVAVAGFTVIARRQPQWPRLTAWLFAAGVMTNVLVGRVPFALGIALAVLAWLCADARRRRPSMLALAALLALATVWASPPAGLFLVLAGAARRLSGERRDTAAAIALAVPPDRRRPGRRDRVPRGRAATTSRRRRSGRRSPWASPGSRCSIRGGARCASARSPRSWGSSRRSSSRPPSARPRCARS